MNPIINKTFPINLDFRFPAEWEEHEATWLSFPHNSETWENRLELIYPSYFAFIKAISESEKVRINVNDIHLKQKVETLLEKFEVSTNNIEIFVHKTNDSWCRDHGPAFLKNKITKEKAIVNWEYNAWGGKYPPFDFDNNIPIAISDYYNLPIFNTGVVMEGGSIDVNGFGALLTSESCLLNKNRNPHLSKIEIERFLMNYYCVEQILWVKDGIVGDDTDGHIDDTTRFVSENKVITCIEHLKSDENYKPLSENLKILSKMRLLNNKPLDIVELPMPKPVFSERIRLPASYANFYITNKNVIVPTYRCKTDEKALSLIQDCFKDKKVIGIDSTEIIWGLGSFHCLSQQEPL